LFLLPWTMTVRGFLGVSALLALGNGLATPTFTGMASRHVHGRAQGRVLGLMAAAGSLGRALGPSIAVIPLPKGFSDPAIPHTGAFLEQLNHGYGAAFTGAAVLATVAGILALLLKVPKEEAVGTAEVPSPALPSRTRESAPS